MANQSVEELDACFLLLAVTVMLRTYTCHACAYACWKQSRIFDRWGTLSEVLEHLRDYQPRYRPQAVGCLPLQRLAPSPGKFQQVSSPPL